MGDLKTIWTDVHGKVEFSKGAVSTEELVKHHKVADSIPPQIQHSHFPVLP